MNSDTLSHSRLLTGLASNDIAVIMRFAETIQVKRDTQLFADGDPATHLYLIVTGQIRLYKLTPTGRQSVFRIAEAHEVIGLSAIVSESRYTLYAQSISAGHMLAWPTLMFQSLMQQFPQLQRNAMQLLSEYREDLQDQLLEMATNDVEIRLAKALVRWMKRHCDMACPAPLTIPLLQRDLADLIGASPYTISRLLHQWQEEGLVQVQHGRLIVSDRQQLFAKAEVL
ncbi:Crp/Fnr family transcriptional regulator [Chloroflexus aggregans]|uniref:Transcriptional regulator, Crp/Fnr family n=1 Tax=Chloroflexus aggregans (strain MD-66 / DSM 9485) TaxID=326427 RepID=B8GBU8_CHLAD|nr:Crp/Fnr family transcriptional regulator [Chloroflexus aggregans]ACL24915.1 transcriptional regulator, Crp/Fnr family [Chloroflexus aggregans DSM 9485]